MLLVGNTSSFLDSSFYFCHQVKNVCPNLQPALWVHIVGKSPYLPRFVQLQWSDLDRSFHRNVCGTSHAVHARFVMVFLPLFSRTMHQIQRVINNISYNGIQYWDKWLKWTKKIVWKQARKSKPSATKPSFQSASEEPGVHVLKQLNFTFQAHHQIGFSLQYQWTNAVYMCIC